jgi:peptidoglycan hydrolase FlgJ
MALQSDGMSNLAINAQSLDALRRQAKQSPEQALKQAAQQFESVFMNMMMKSMREATPQDGMFDNEQTKMFTSMLDQQLAQNVSARGVGLADVMAKQLGRNLSHEGVAGQTPAAAPAIYSLLAGQAPVSGKK